MNNIKIGQIDTPIATAKEFAIRYKLVDKWLEGKTIFDPTCGTGNLFEALVEIALSKNISVSELNFNNLYGVEIDPKRFHLLKEKFLLKYNVKLNNSNFLNQDFIVDYGSQKFDIIFGNPPWLTFPDLPNSYKALIRPLFSRYGLVDNKKEVILGGSRIDIAALVIQKAIFENLKINGNAYFFIPLSLLFNTGAHRSFRNFSCKLGSYRIREIFDFDTLKVFHGINTRCGFIAIDNGAKQEYPITSYCYENEKLVKKKVEPSDANNGALSYCSNQIGKAKIEIKKESTPRQGVNACGATHIFYFDECTKLNNGHCLVGNKILKNILLEEKFIYPVVSKGNVISDNKEINKWVLLPYNKNGKALSKEQLQNNDLLYNYLLKHKEKLISRKGIMLSSSIKKGLWWALLGVGVYNFAPYKIMWQSYGVKEFIPKLFQGEIQANQSLQCFMPFYRLDEARETLNKLQHPSIKQFFKSFAMGGTMSFAQPGKIKSILTINSETGKLKLDSSL